MLKYINENLFTWSRWRAGNPSDLGLICRYNILINNKVILNEYAIGYCDSEKLICRQKENCKAIMFFKNNIHFWFHITNKEFEVIYES